MDTEMERTIPVRVAVRCRPLVAKEKLEGCQICTQPVPSQKKIVIRGEKSFTCDYVFGDESSQEAVYEALVSRLLQKILDGFNVTILAYGQTGSGKTFTMGTCCSANDVHSKDTGIIPRAVEDIFNQIATSSGKTFVVRASFLEIYKERVYDLISQKQDRQPLEIREDKTGSIKVTNLTEHRVTTPKDIGQLLKIGSASRSTASTKMNVRSSRSHAIFTLSVEQHDEDNGGSTKIAKFHLVDLAGSERTEKTGAVGDRLKEGININRGLLSLGNVISALCDGDIHVPYRDSKLTRLLQDSLGGNSHTLMIACISPADSNMEETLNTLRYASRARKIKNKPVVNLDPTQAEIALLSKQLQEAMTELARCKLVQSEQGVASSVGDDGGESKDLEVELSRYRQLEAENQRLKMELKKVLNQLSENSQHLNLNDLSNRNIKEPFVNLSEQADKHLAGSDGDQPTSLLNDLQSAFSEFTDEEPAGDDGQYMNTIREEIAADDEGTTGKQILRTPRCEQLRMVSTRRRNDLALKEQLEDLNRRLQAKEYFASKMPISEQRLDVMKTQYEATKNDLVREIDALKKEKDDLSALIASQTSSAKSQGLAEQRRKKILDLEQRVTQLRKQATEQSHAIKMKQDAERQTKQLQQEIMTMKQNRVQLMRRLKEEADSYRRQQSQHRKEVRALRYREQQKKTRMARLERQCATRVNVLKRRLQEALAAKERLEAASRRREYKPAKAHQLDDLHIKKWLQDELNVVSESKKLERHVASLIDERKSITMEIHRLENLLKNPEEKEDRGYHESCQEKLREVQHEHNERIAELQQKILDVEPETRMKAFLSNVNDLWEGKAITAQTFQMLLEKRIETNVAVSKDHEGEQALAERRPDIEKFDAEIELLKNDFELKLINLKREHEKEKLFLLKNSDCSTLQSNPEMIASLVEMLKSKIQAISKDEYLHDELQKKTEELEALQMELGKFRSGRKMFFEDLSAKKPKRRPLKRKTVNVPVLTFDDLETSTESELDDTLETQTEWRPSIEYNTIGVSQGYTRASACKCRGLCRPGRCGCSRKKKSCTSMCSCKGDCSVSQRLDTESTTSDSDLPETA